MSNQRVKSYALALLTCTAFLFASFGCSNPAGPTASDSALEGAAVQNPTQESIPSASDKSDQEVMFSQFDDVEP